jgi:hypothetical protein
MKYTASPAARQETGSSKSWGNLSWMRQVYGNQKQRSKGKFLKNEAPYG